MKYLHKIKLIKIDVEGHEFEVLEGFKTSTLLPAEEMYCLYHPKTIAKQEKQNNYYNTL